MRRLALLVPVVLLAFGSAGAEGPASGPTTSATAWAIRVSVPGQPVVSTPVAADGAVTAGSSFAYPADGSVASAQSTTASTTTGVARYASARAESAVTALSVFGGEIQADAVTAMASAGTGYSGAGGNQDGSAATNLRVFGQPASGRQIALADWGTLTLDTTAVDRTAPLGTRGYQGTVVELAVKLGAPHGGLPAGSEIQVGFAAAAVQTAPAGSAGTTTETTPTVPVIEPPTGDRPQDLPRGHKGKAKHQPLKIHPLLASGPYVFPVFGQSAYVDTFGAARADVSYHHGDDIFGTLGEPLVAVTDGTVFSVGYEKIGGNRLWILDSQGNQFYYAHLAAFSMAARNGDHVRAGEVIGFMGNTGDAEGTPVHLHFEVHPVSTLYLGYDGAVDPTPYLDVWRHEADLPYPIAAAWAPNVKGATSGPAPGAILLGMNDISSADGLDPASLRRALEPPAAGSLLRLPAQHIPVPTKDLGKNHGPGT